jgi:hypothetical protein
VNETLLTGDGRGLLEDLGDQWVHGDHVVALLGHPLIPEVHLCVDPVLEVLPHDGVDDVREVAPAELLDLLAGWQSTLHISIVLGECEDVLDAQAFKLRYIDDFDIVTRNDSLGPHGKVPEVPDSNSLIAWQVSPDLGGEEPVDLPLALKLGGESGLRYLC